MVNGSNPPTVTLAYRVRGVASSHIVVTPRDSYACNYRKLSTLLTLSEGLAESGSEPLTLASMRENLSTQLHPNPPCSSVETVLQ